MDQRQCIRQNIESKILYYEKLLADRTQYGNECLPMNDDVKVIRNLLKMYYKMLRELERDIS